MFRKTKQFLKDNEGAIMMGAGVVIGASAVIAYPRFFMNVTEEFYNPAQPIPGLHVDEGTIIRELVSGFIAADFLRKKELTGEFGVFAAEFAKKSLDIRNQVQ